MKVTKFFFAALALIGAFASCNPEDKPGDDPAETKSSECKLTSFVVTVDGETIDAFVDQSDKTIEVTYFKYQFDALKSATAVATISEKATISPDPTTAIDYTVEGGVEFTVTAEDGTTKTKYTAFLALAEVSEKVAKVWEKTYGQLGLTAKPNYDCGIAFCAIDKFAYADCRVFDLTGAYLGNLNIEGIPSLGVYADGAIAATGQLAAMSNDDNGVLVAITSTEGVRDDGSTGCRSSVYAWIDGWDKAPTKVYGPVDYQCMYMSVSGDVKGDFILNFRTGHGNPQMHHVLIYTGANGKYFKDNGGANCTWVGPMIPHTGQDGCWGQQLSFFSADPEEGFVCWDSFNASEYGEEGNASSAFYVYNEGLTAFVNGEATELPLYGGVIWSVFQAVGQHFRYGNHSTGHVRAFKYNGQKYIIASTCSWPCNWITVQRADNIVEDDPETDEVDESTVNYLLPTDRIDDVASGAVATYPCSAYVFDPATRTGHIVMASQNYKVLAYDITTTIL
ncbi:MAG: DUF5018 domain-containing protein [Bacteroidales bacterium]|nr:DUF5018 domain-containing protein [Bacteroidales bacterium]